MYDHGGVLHGSADVEKLLGLANLAKPGGGGFGRVQKLLSPAAVPSGLVTAKIDAAVGIGSEHAFLCATS